MTDLDQPRRSTWLVFGVFLANAFLLGMTVDALISFADDALVRSAADTAFFTVRVLFALAVLALGLVMLFVVIFVPPLPKLVLLPPILVELWLAFGALPLDWSPTDHASMLPLVLIQFAVTALAFATNRLRTGHWFIAARRLPRKSNLWLRTLIALPVSLATAATLIIAMFVAIFVFYLQEQSGGYLRFAGAGIEVRETVLRKGDRTVHLVATVHIAEPKFYRDLYAAIPPDALVLAEGVTDRKGLMRSGLPYDNAAAALGLETQGVFQELLAPGAAAREKDDEAAPPNGKKTGPRPPPGAPARTPGPRLRPDVIYADADISDFTPLTLSLLRDVGRLYASRDFGELLARFNALNAAFTEDDMKVFLDDIIYKRNTRVLAELDKRLPEYATVFIPWGAQHMPDLEAALKDRGFKIANQRMIPLAKYGTILDAIWTRLGR